jgi:hypothetical protein
LWSGCSREDFSLFDYEQYVWSQRVEVNEFETFTDDLIRMRSWLCEHDCPIVAMESTGIYWKPIHNVLEGSIIMPGNRLEEKVRFSERLRLLLMVFRRVHNFSLALRHFYLGMS